MPDLPVNRDTPAPAAPAAPPVVRPNLPLGLVVAMSCLALFMVVLDATIVTVALPDMKQGLGLSAAGSSGS